MKLEEIIEALEFNDYQYTIQGNVIRSGGFTIIIEDDVIKVTKPYHAPIEFNDLDKFNYFLSL